MTVPPRLLAPGLLLALGLLAGCETMPDGPAVEVMPAPRKSIEVFEQDDRVCRGFAERQIGAAPARADSQAVEAAVVGTALGAAAGAMIGHGDGEAIGVGAGTGLLLGAARGSDRARHAGYSLQERYDIAYMQCMYTKGNQVPGYPLAPSAR